MPILLGTVGGCASAPQQTVPAVSPAMLLRGEPLTGATEPPPLPDVPVLALDPRMREFIARHVRSDGSAHLKLNQLLDAIIDGDVFKLEYDQVTRTAAETFRERGGNCLSFTNMFVAMARAVGLRASFQEVDIPPDWTKEGDSLLLSRHINVYIELGAARDRIVDFNIEDFRASYDQQRVSDTRAFAHFYNNVGVRRMQDGEPVEALRHFRKALEQDPRFAPAWSNLGTLYMRHGYPAWAEAAWREALASNPRELVAMSNMVRMLQGTGRTREAAQYRRMISRHRLQNPYYRYYLARQSFLAEDYAAAIRHLKFAVVKKPAEDSFYLLLARSYLKQGDRDSARRALMKAEEIAPEDALRRNYRRKLELLFSQTTGR